MNKIIYTVNADIIQLHFIDILCIDNLMKIKHGYMYIDRVQRWRVYFSAISFVIPLLNILDHRFRIYLI